MGDITTQGSWMGALDDEGKFGDQLVMEGSEEVAQPVCASTTAENVQMHKLEDVAKETLQIEDSIVNVDMLEFDSMPEAIAMCSDDVNLVGKSSPSLGPTSEIAVPATFLDPEESCELELISVS